MRTGRDLSGLKWALESRVGQESSLASSGRLDVAGDVQRLVIHPLGIGDLDVDLSGLVEAIFSGNKNHADTKQNDGATVVSS